MNVPWYFKHFFLYCTLDYLHTIDIYILSLSPLGSFCQHIYASGSLWSYAAQSIFMCFHIADESEWGTWFIAHSTLGEKMHMCICVFKGFEHTLFLLSSYPSCFTPKLCALMKPWEQRTSCHLLTYTRRHQHKLFHGSWQPQAHTSP